ncbi:MAG TPA: hypothetical protein PLO84_14110 [Thermotogota bacterium]|nr:hypothetical protein [Thermotogota bacterium]
MPRMNEGGNFVYGVSVMRETFEVKIPPQAYEEYHCCKDDVFILMSGSDESGGFCVTSKRLLAQSELQNILFDNPVLNDEQIHEEWIQYKGRKYTCRKNNAGKIRLTAKDLEELEMHSGAELMCIRGTDIAFSFAAKGILIQKMKEYGGELEMF